MWAAVQNSTFIRTCIFFCCFILTFDLSLQINLDDDKGESHQNNNSNPAPLIQPFMNQISVLSAAPTRLARMSFTWTDTFSAQRCTTTCAQERVVLKVDLHTFVDEAKV